MPHSDHGDETRVEEDRLAGTQDEELEGTESIVGGEGEEVDVSLDLEGYLAYFRSTFVDGYNLQIRRRDDWLQNGWIGMVARAIERGEEGDTVDWIRHIYEFLMRKSNDQERLEEMQRICSEMIACTAEDIIEFDAGGYVRQNAERMYWDYQRQVGSGGLREGQSIVIESGYPGRRSIVIT